MYCIILWICLCQSVPCSANCLCYAYCHPFPVSSDTVDVDAPRLLHRPYPHHLGPESTSQVRRILPTPPDCLSRTQGAVTRGPTINHGLPSTPSPIWTLPALPLHELNCPWMFRLIYVNIVVCAGKGYILVNWVGGCATITHSLT